MTASKRNRQEPERTEPLLTTAQVAQIANVSEQTVRRWRFDGDLPFFQLGYRTVRYRRDDVDELILRNRRVN